MNNALLAICFMAIVFSAYGLVNDDDYQDRMDADTDFIAQPAKQYGTCEIKQYKEVHVFKCEIINDKLARII
jgi:hypothetical protein